MHTRTMRISAVLVLLLSTVAWIAGCGTSSSALKDRAQQKEFREAARLLALGNDKPALNRIEKAVALAPKEYESYMIAASLLGANEEFDRAVPLIERGLRQGRAKPGRLSCEADRVYRAGLYRMLGQSCWQSGRKDDAEKAYREAIRLDPDDASAYNDLGYMLADANMKLGEALKLTLRAAELEPRNGMILDSVGWAYFRLGRHEEAMKYLKQAVQLNPSDSEIRIHLAEAHRAVGNKHAALVEYRKALRITGPNKGVREQAEQLAKDLSRSEP